MKREIPKITAKKSLGQHFLTNSLISEVIVKAGSVSAKDTVLEIGPGTGMLTRELLRTGAKVIAIEADVRAVVELKDVFSTEIANQKLTLLHEDIRAFDLESLSLRTSGYKVIANIPYYISGMLFRTFLEARSQPSDIVFLVQKEVAERIARSKKESLLSLSVKLYGEPKYVQTVKRGNFSPPPKVDSAVLSITKISRERLKSLSEEVFFEVLHEGFKSKRKQLLGNMTTLLPRETLTHIFSTLDISHSARGEDLPLSKWLLLCTEIEKQRNP